MIIVITSKNHRDMGLHLKGGWGWKDEPEGPETTITAKTADSQRPELAESRVLESEGQKQQYYFLFITHTVPSALTVSKTLHFELLKLQVYALIICVCLFLRQHSVNAHCDFWT